MKTLFVGAFIMVAGLFSSTAAYAQSCNSETSCKKFVICPTGYQELNDGQGAYCKAEGKGTPAQTTPTCNFRNGTNNWTFNTTKKGCFNDKTGTVAIENINCPKDYEYNKNTLKCEKPSVGYSQTQLSMSNDNTARPQSCSSPSACAQETKCDTGYTRTLANGGGFFCQKSEPTSSVAPTCPSGFTFNGSTDKCEKKGVISYAFPKF